MLRRIPAPACALSVLPRVSRSKINVARNQDQRREKSCFACSQARNSRGYPKREYSNLDGAIVRGRNCSKIGFLVEKAF